MEAIESSIHSGKGSVSCHNVVMQDGEDGTLRTHNRGSCLDENTEF